MKKMGNSKTKPEKSDSPESNESNTTSTTPSIYPQLQIRNCIRNVRNNSSSFTDMYPNEAGSSCGQIQSSVYTIDVNNGVQANFSNPGYVSTEGSGKALSSDGLPSYEEAIGAVKSPIAPASQTRPTIEVVNEGESTIDGGDGSGGCGSEGTADGGRRHRRRHRNHRHHHNSHNENSEPNATDSEPSRRHRHRRGLRKHLAKMKRRNYTETE